MIFRSRRFSRNDFNFLFPPALETASAKPPLPPTLDTRFPVIPQRRYMFTAMEESSRVFVKNLPPTINEVDFRKHFSTGREVTDIKLFPKRRIGYVGFKTPQDASKAVKYFNKSFIRMSKIAVEIARPIADPSLPTARRPNHNHVEKQLPTPEPEPKAAKEKADVNNKKRKREDLDESDPKLKEYLDVMRPGQTPSSKLEGIRGQPVEDKGLDVPIIPAEEGESDDEYEQIPTRQQKRQKEDGQDAISPAPAPEAEVPIVDAPPVVTEDAPKTLHIPDATADATDDDWLRSRTNRLLDLVDPDDPAAFASVTAPRPAQQPTAASKPPQPQPEDVDMADAPLEAEAPNEPAAEGTNEDDPIQQIRRTSRLYVRNLPFKASEAELSAHFEKYGELAEVHIPVSDTSKGTNRGFAYVLFGESDSAVSAYQEADGKPFQGRILHVIPGQSKPKKQHLSEFEISQLPLKKQNLLRRKIEADKKRFQWNSLFMNQDAVLASTADRLGISKSELLDPTSTDAAVKQAVAETQVIQETKEYFAGHGVHLDAFKSEKKGDTAILVKNFPYGTTLEELRKLFEDAAGGNVLQVLMPPSKTLAIVHFSQPVACRTAFAKLSYKRMGTLLLKLEKAPANLFSEQPPTTQPQTTDRPAGVQKVSATDLLQREDDQDDGETTSLYIRNLNFDTTTSHLVEAFRSLDGFVSAQVKTKLDPKKPGQVLSMGFGFAHFRSKAQAEAALKIMDGYVLDGHTLGVKASHKGHDAAEERRREDKAKKSAGQRTKVVVKNLAFEASKADIRRLLGTYGKLRVVRIPRKADNTSRGFAFAEFESPREAENCIKALNHTHLLGRRLVLDYAEAEAVDAEEEIAKMQKKIGGQVNKVALQKLTGKGREKFEIGDENEDDA